MIIKTLILISVHVVSYPIVRGVEIVSPYIRFSSHFAIEPGGMEISGLVLYVRR